jgi:hypothetical protein
MAKQTPVLVKSFAADTPIAGANVCVVMSGTNAGNVALPAAPLATRFVGVVQEAVAQGSTTNEVAVLTTGIARIQSDGSAAIAPGDYVAIANTAGQIKSVTPAGGTNLRQVIGIALSGAANTAGLLVDVLLQPAIYIGA